MRRPLNADDLGAKGESRFSEICADASLVCNPSTRDRTGWDFIVEFPIASIREPSTLDKRDTPLSCHIQVKTIWSSTSTIEMRLSSAERLAKEPKPSFVYIFTVDDKLQFQNSYLIHLLDEPLSKILKRLRSEQAKGEAALNKKTIKLNKNLGCEILPTGDALANKIAELCTNSMEDYLAKKKSQLKTLGFTPHSYLGTMTLQVKDHTDFVDVFLGLKQAEVKKFRMFETRFGIKLPIERQTGGTIHIRPEPSDKAQITFRSRDYSHIAEFNADVFIPALPNLPKEEGKILIDNPLFQIQIIFKNNALNLSTKGEAIESGRFTLEEWINILKMYVVLSEGTGFVTISPQRLRPLSQTIAFPHAISELEKPAYYLFLIRTLEAARRLLQIVGASSQTISLDDLSEPHKIVGLHDLVTGKTAQNALSFEAHLTIESEMPETADTLFINFQNVAGVMIAFHAVGRVRIEQKGSIFYGRTETIDVQEVVAIRNFPEDYTAFTERVRKSSDLKFAVINNP